MAGLPPLPPAAGASPSPSNPRLNSTSPKVGDRQPQAMPATAANKLGFDGGEPEHGTDAVGRVGVQGIDGGEPPTRTDGGGDPTMRTDGAGGKRPQTPQAKNDSLVKKRKKHNDPTTIKASQSRNQGLRSPMQVTMLREFGSENEAETWMVEVKKNMEELFKDYNKEFGEESHRDNGTQEVQDGNDPLAEWDQYMKSKRQQSSTELDQYLKEQLTPRKEEIDILCWWKVKSEIYPVLSRIARDVLAIPASTVPSESAFSTGGRVVSDYKSSLTPTTIEALICLQDWFKAADARKNERLSS